MKVTNIENKDSLSSNCLRVFDVQKKIASSTMGLRNENKDQLLSNFVNNFSKNNTLEQRRFSSLNSACLLCGVYVLV